MDKQAKSRYGWRWIIVLIGGMSWVSLGCNPQSLSMFLMPFSDNNIQPEHKLFAADKEITLAILTTFAKPQINPDLQAGDMELGELTANAFRKRCADNGHKLKIIPIAQVRAEESKQRQLRGGDISALDLGKSLKADYVLELTINSLSIFEPRYNPPMYRGNSSVTANLFKMEVKNDDPHKVYAKDFSRAFPRDTPLVESSGMPATAFRNQFLGRVANDVVKLFISYPPDERREVE